MRAIIIYSTLDVANELISFLRSHGLSVEVVGEKNSTTIDALKSGVGIAIQISNGICTIPIGMGMSQDKRNLPARITIYAPHTWRDAIRRIDPSLNLAVHVRSLLLSEYGDGIDVDNRIS
jgi:hypothetical protein